MTTTEKTIEQWLAKAIGIDPERVAVSLNHEARHMDISYRGNLNDDDRDELAQTGLLWSSQFGVLWVVKVSRQAT